MTSSADAHPMRISLQPVTIGIYPFTYMFLVPDVARTHPTRNKT